MVHNPKVEGSIPPRYQGQRPVLEQKGPLACLVLTDLRTVAAEVLFDTAWIFGHILTTTVLLLGDVKSRLSELVGRVRDHHERVTVTVHGRPSAILIAPEDLEALEETLEIMRDAATMNRLAESDAELARGEYVSAEELAEAMRRRRAQ